MSERLKQGITRVEVIGPSGRVLVCDPRGAGGSFEAEAHYQDGGRTLKVFISREPDYVAGADGGTPSREWQPIASAPKDGTEVLVYRPKMRGRDRIQIRAVRDWCGPTCCPSAEPTHWMPLPAPPSGETTEPQE